MHVSQNMTLNLKMAFYAMNFKKLDSVSDLGVRFDYKLSFLEHINEDINKA